MNREYLIIELALPFWVTISVNKIIYFKSVGSTRGKFCELGLNETYNYDMDILVSAV